MATFALVTTVGPEPRPARSTRWRHGNAENRQAFANSSARFNDGGFRVTAEAKLRPLARFGCSIVGATVAAVRRTRYPLPQQLGRQLSRNV